MIPGDISKEELLQLLWKYNEYIQNANDEKKYDTGWVPVCVNEFYDNEFQEIMSGDVKDER